MSSLKAVKSLESCESRASTSDQTEEDVCFPLNNYEHKWVNGINFDAMNEFIKEYKEEQLLNTQLKSVKENKPSNTNESILMNPSRDQVPSSSRHNSDGSSKSNATNADKSAFSSPLSTASTLSLKINSISKHDKIDKNTDNGINNNTGKKIEMDSNDNLDSSRKDIRFCNDDSEKLYEFPKLERTDRFSFFSSTSEETIHAPNFPSLFDGGLKVQELFEKEEDESWWLDCMCPTDSEMRMLSKSFGIHPLTSEDIRVQESREKVELFKTYYFVAFHTFLFNDDEDEFEPVNMYMVVFRNGILSFHYEPIKHTSNVRKRIRQLRDYVTVSPDWICYALIDDITDGFAPAIRDIETEAEGIEDSVFVARPTDHNLMLLRIGISRKHIMSLMRLLSGKADVVKMFAKRCDEQNYMAPRGEIGLYLGDIHDHITTMYLNLVSYEKILSRSHANYLAQVQIEDLGANNRVNELLSKVTVIGTTIVPLNLITGLWGMNVKVPGLNQDTFGWFFGIVGVLVLLIIGSYLAARQWLWGPVSSTNILNPVEVELENRYRSRYSRNRPLRSLFHEERRSRCGSVTSHNQDQSYFDRIISRVRSNSIV